MVARDENELFPGSEVNLGSTVGDGSGGEFLVTTLALTNPHLALLTIEGALLADGTKGFELLDDLTGTTLDVGDSIELRVRFDPNAAGDYSDSLVITSDAGLFPSYALNLTASAIASAPVAKFELVDNNNFGGVLVGSDPISRPELFSITNEGAADLTLSNFEFLDGSAAFALLGIPEDLTTNPVTLATGETFAFGLEVYQRSPGPPPCLVHGYYQRSGENGDRSGCHCYGSGGCHRG